MDMSKVQEFPKQVILLDSSCSNPARVEIIVVGSSALEKLTDDNSGITSNTLEFPSDTKGIKKVCKNIQ